MSFTTPKQPKKYSVTMNYSPNACGVNREGEFDTIDQVLNFAEETMRHHYASVKIFDTQLNDFVFWKDCMEKPYIDLLIRPEHHNRDLRTKDRKRH